jgi:ATP-dependent helicase/nuclease subunit A
LIGEKSNPIELTKMQSLAVRTLDRDVLVTAGAGSGKTRTLVARYLAMLESGVSPRQLAAITFTEKAAREMRNRVRTEAARRANLSTSSEEQVRWQDLQAQLDAARIGTIHSLCAEILRSHPVASQVDPDFEVVEEGLAAMIKAQTVDEAIIRATLDPETAPLFHLFSTHSLTRLLRFLLDRRLDVSRAMSDSNSSLNGKGKLHEELWKFRDNEEILEAVRGLAALSRDGLLMADAGALLAGQVETFLESWGRFLEACEAGDDFGAANTLFDLRRQHMALNLGKKESAAKAHLRCIQAVYDAEFTPWLGGKNATDQPPDEEIEALYQEGLSRLYSLFGYASEAYRSTLDSSYALDFDDLEAKALELLGREDIRRHWQGLLVGVLVDEFQDTNDRQQMIVKALCGDCGRLFVVGDARQSIYRFRGADVTVFRRMQDDVAEEGSVKVELERTFRAHPELLSAIDDLLAPIMGSEESTEDLYRIPYTPMHSDRREQRQGIRRPFVEVVCGIGASAEEARPITAQALAERLVEFRADGQVQRWADVALLFRASTGFQPYEDALETMQIPFVTVAGRGFYDRPEIRDVLNMLRALADKSDDQAWAGLLRSPAIGLSDESLYRLRWVGAERRSFWDALQGDLAELGEVDRARAERARGCLESMEDLIDRLPVAEVLKRWIDETDYRAVLASTHGRLLRNLDKLLQDAHTSELIRVRAFLDYVETLRDVGAREGEAPVEMEGAVRLMTIHKAKGLEFDVVVLADASHRLGGGYQAAYLIPEIGFAVAPDRLEATPLATRLARYMERQESQAEDDRLLYVALTRAREKILVSGHLSETRTGVRADGWLKALLDTLDVDLEVYASSPSNWHECRLPCGDTVGLWFQRQADEVAAVAEPVEEWPTSKAKPLYGKVVSVERDQVDEKAEGEPVRDWRATGERIRPPAAVVGRMVHEVLRQWLPAENPSLGTALEMLALQEGLVDADQRRQAVQGARRLIERLWNDPRWRELASAPERYREIPYACPLERGMVDLGTIDLMIREEGGGWRLVDFKTDELQDEESLEKSIEGYRKQLTRYKRAVRALFKTDVRAEICFLDYQGAIEWVAVVE